MGGDRLTKLAGTSHEIAPLTSPSGARKWSTGDTRSGSDPRTLPPDISLEEGSDPQPRYRSPLAQAVEYLGLGLLVLGFAWLLLYAATTSHLKRRGAPRPWPQPHSDYPGWMEQHEKYVSQVTIMQQEDMGIEMIFYGDSITEMWRGTLHDRPDPRAVGVPTVFAQVFHTYSTEVFAISGDSSSHLMWRLLNGEAPYNLRVKVIVVLIGTNDLMYASFKGDVAIARVGNATVHHLTRILQLLGEAAPRATTLALALLPRGDMTRHPDGSMYAQPSKFTPVIDFINRQLEVVASGMETVRYLDCGAPFLTQNKSGLDLELMPDALHPSIKGMKLLGECIHSAAKDVLGH